MRDQPWDSGQGDRMWEQEGQQGDEFWGDGADLTLQE